MQNKELP